MKDKASLTARADLAKCSGINCGYRQSCGRFLRPEAETNQVWGSYYALGDEDCDYFEPVNNENLKHENP